MKKHKREKQIRALADGAKLQFRHNDITKCNGNWFNVNKQKISFLSRGDILIRVSPTCQYAIDKIIEIGGDKAIQLYRYWLDGGSIEYGRSEGTIKELPNSGSVSHKFEVFISILNNDIRKKKKTVKQVLWVLLDNIERYEMKPTIVYDFQSCYVWINEDTRKLSHGWHKVPRCTREIEIEE